MKTADEIYKKRRDELNSLYSNLDAPELAELLKLCQLPPEKASKIAVCKRLVDLKEEGLVAEWKKCEFSEEKIRALKALCYEFVQNYHENRHAQLLAKLSPVLDKFENALLQSIHEVGVFLSQTQKEWQRKVIDQNSAWFEANFATLSEATSYIDAQKLYQKNPDGTKCDRCYGVLVNGENGEKRLLPYASVFDFDVLEKAFDKAILNLSSHAKTPAQKSYVAYFEALKAAFLERENEHVVARWQEAERAWMQTRGRIQVGHPLEYYEDAFTHAVALEWDARLNDTESIDEASFKSSVERAFTQICQRIGGVSEELKNAVKANLQKTQLYICNPLLFYGAEFCGLFSAQVVPNDEFVSSECGKKIFAFVDFVYKNALSRPKMRLTSEVFEANFRDFCEEVLHDEKLWKKTYEVSTIGHEFGHILFVGSQTERLMNKSGEFKFIEEFKATTGGLVNFFLDENAQNEKLKRAVLAELVKRSVGLVAWQKVNETRAYYCEGLIHLTLLYKAGVIDFDRYAVKVNLSRYENFKTLCVETYEKLATHYARCADASEFLREFAAFDGEIYLPTNANVRAFVEAYYTRYTQIANETL